jgi:hypothetical protein
MTTGRRAGSRRAGEAEGHGVAVRRDGSRVRDPDVPARGHPRLRALHGQPGDGAWGGELVELRGDGTCSVWLGLVAAMSLPEVR